MASDELPNVLFIPDEIAYTGEQLRSHWAYANYDLVGDSIVAFVGPCDVKPQHMRDVEDLKASSRIYSERMLHFLVEHFDADLQRAVLRQRLFMAILSGSLNRRFGETRVRREGSDLYDGKSKLTVSVASVSPVSALIHAGINISSRNTPVPTLGLDDYGIAPVEFGKEALAAYAKECAAARKARCKVRACE